MTQDYYGTKRITAFPRTANHNGLDESDGYAVIYPDGYQSWSPKEAFESAYQLLSALSFGHALEALKAGCSVARSGWNGKGMFLYFVPANSYPAQTDVAKKFIGETVPYGAYIAMKTAQGNVVPWLASQTDIVAEDWQVIHDAKTGQLHVWSDKADEPQTDTNVGSSEDDFPLGVACEAAGLGESCEGCQ
jgi:hypothetical protein